MVKRQDDDLVGNDDFDLYAKSTTGKAEADEARRGSNHGIAADQLRAFIERVERLEEEKKAIGDDIKEVYSEAKGSGFDTKVMREIIKIRKQDRNQRAEYEAILDLYLHALGMADDPGDYDGDEE